MKKSVWILSIFLGAFVLPVYGEPQFFSAYPFWLAAATPNETPRIAEETPVINNRYLVESIRANNLAKQAFDDGDYDLSMQFSADAIRAAKLSDELITQKLKIATANDKIDEAKDRLAWAENSRARAHFPKEYNSAKAFYNQALIARNGGEWNDALNNALYSIQALYRVVAPPQQKPGNSSSTQAWPSNMPLPAQYTVRPWDTFGDCFWNIAAKSWVYGDPYRWPLLYRANKAKLPDPNNPNWIEPGLVLDIPSLRGEARQGMWDSGSSYTPLQR